MVSPHTGHDGHTDFDFLMGRWTVQHRRLRERLKGSTEWEEFAGTSIARPLLGGLGNIDENIMERASGRVEGVSLRLYDPTSRQWSIYWADSVNVILQAPMIGGFVEGRGEFYDQELFEGRAIFSRFIWSDIADNTCHWEQAFSEDGGRSWETNWTMEFTRQE
jgi:hypothetical protein